jgi:hypothetical protein
VSGLVEVSILPLCKLRRKVLAVDRFRGMASLPSSDVAERVDGDRRNHANRPRGFGRDRVANPLVCLMDWAVCPVLHGVDT